MGLTLNVQIRRALPFWTKMIGGQGTFSIPSFRLCCAARNFRGCLSVCSCHTKQLLDPRNLHCYTTKRFPALGIRIVTLQSTFLPQKSALLLSKALFCPKNPHCCATKHFSACNVTGDGAVALIVDKIAKREDSGDRG